MDSESMASEYFANYSREKTIQNVHKKLIKYDPSYAEDNTNEALLTSSVSPRKNRVKKNKNFHGAVQSNNAVFYDFGLVKICHFSEGGL